MANREGKYLTFSLAGEDAAGAGELASVMAMFRTSGTGSKEV